MAFCPKCGTQLAGNEQFCAHCGNDVSATLPAAAPAPIAPVQAAAVAYAPTPVAPPAAPYPQYYAPQGQIPIMAAPPEVPKHHGAAWWLVIIAGILFGLWYIGTHDQQSQQAPTPPPGGAPPATGPNAAIIAQQSYTTNWNVINGDLHLSNQQWVNNSQTTIQSADLECDQYDQAGTDQAQKHVDLTDQTGAAVKPGTTEQFGDLDIGAAVTGLTKVNCGIVGVTPATQ
jgi:hypothetical protein